MNGRLLLEHVSKWKVLYIAVLFASLSFLGVNAFDTYTPTVMSDKGDYAPGEVAFIKGYGWTRDDTVDVHLEEEPAHEHHHGYHNIVVQEDGSWQIEYPIEDRHLGVKFTVIAEGKQSGVKSYAYFTDANITFSASGLPAETSLSISYRIGTGENLPTGTFQFTSSFIPPNTPIAVAVNNKEYIEFSFPNIVMAGETYSATKINVNGDIVDGPSNIYRVPSNSAKTINAIYSKICTTPSISTQPAASTVTYGDNAAFTVVATGTAPYNYQWQVNSGNGYTNISNANTAALSLTNPAVSLSGSLYRCVVTNACGTVTSDAAMLTVQKAAAMVTLANMEHTYNGNAKSASATTNAFGASSFTFTYDGSTELPVNHKPGGYTVIATLANDNYSGSATGTLTINKANQIITWATPESIVYGAALSASQLNATLTTGDGTLSYVPALGTMLDAGENQSLTVTAAGTNNYNEAQASVTINVAKATPTVALTVGGPYTYDGNSKSAVATVAGVGGAGLEAATISYKKGDAAVAAPLNAGSYEVLASFAGNTNYNTASALGTLVINKAVASFVTSNLEHVYDGTVKSITVATSPEGLTGVTLTNNGKTDVGDYSVGISLNNENYVTEATSAILRISPRAITVTASAGQSKVYGDDNPAVYTYNITTGSLVNNSHLSGALTRVPGENVGTYAITLGTLAATSNYTLQFISGATFSITPKAVTASISASDKVYDGTLTASATGSVSGDQLVDNDVLNVVVSNASFDSKHIGTNKTVTAGVSINNVNYSLNNATATASANITAKEISGTFVAASKEYDGTADATIMSTGLDGAIQNDDVQLTGGAATFADANAGTGKVVTLSGATLSGNDRNNYTLTSVATTTAAITSKLVTASISAQSKVYDGTTAASATGSVPAADLVAGDVVAVNVSEANFDSKNVGTGKTVSANVAISNPNYNLNSPTASTKADITPAALTASITAQDKVYDGSTTATVNAGLEGVMVGDQVTVLFSNGAFADKNAGPGKAVTAAISISGADAGNYTVNATATTRASITARPIAVAAVANSKVYGDNDPALNYTLTSGELVAGDSFSGALKRVEGENVGDYAIQQGGVTAGSNYALTFTGANFEITKAPLTVTAHNSNRFCGQANATFAGTIEGIKRSDAITATYTSVADASSAAGTYAIVPAPEGVNLGNYEVTLVNGVLTIGNVTVDATANSTPQAVKNTATTVTIQVTNSAGGVAAGVPVKLYFDTQSVVEVNTNGSGLAIFTVGVLQPGVYKIRAVAGAGCSESTVYLPVYDPNGGFVTGGGWIDSPAGAYKADMALTGKAHFGFVAKYKKGSTIPDGNTEFQFQAGNLNFNSSAYDDMRLVIAGAKANYKGTGKINGTGNYGFMVSAVDGQATGGEGVDKFRIKIWDKNNGDAVVYDNNVLNTDENADPATALGGGSIVIHDGSNKSVSTAPVAKKVMAEGIDPLSAARFDNYPNAFSDRTTIRFSLDTEQNYALEVYDIRGALVKKVGTGIAEAGKVYEYELDARNLAEGVYFARLATGSRIQTIKMLLKK